MQVRQQEVGSLKQSLQAAKTAAAQQLRQAEAARQQRIDAGRQKLAGRYLGALLAAVPTPTARSAHGDGCTSACAAAPPHLFCR